MRSPGIRFCKDEKSERATAQNIAYAINSTALIPGIRIRAVFGIISGGSRLLAVSASVLPVLNDVILS